MNKQRFSKAYIYALIDPNDGETRYVGMTFDLDNRIRKHTIPSQLKGKTYKERWLKALVENGQQPIAKVLLVVEPELAGDIEAQVIALLKSNGVRLTNTALGGIGWTVGNKHSDEAKKKMSDAHVGRKYELSEAERIRRRSLIGKRKLSDEAKEKIRQAHTGLSPSDETRALISRKGKGRKKSEDTCKKLSEVAQSRPRDPATGLMLSKSGTVTLKTYTCKYCDQVFDSPQNYSAHMYHEKAQRESIRPRAVDMQFKCKVCGLEVNSLAEYGRHFRKEHH